jgi:8-oxo-dGTP pyrophosphatase MutT (NUDIX family)
MTGKIMLLLRYGFGRLTVLHLGPQYCSDRGADLGKTSKLKRLAQRWGHLEQVAALPYRLVDDRVENLTITSRRRKRLIVPKGWPMPGKDDAMAAAIEANEEAGAKGRISKDALGTFGYMKEIDKLSIRVTAKLFPLKVKKLKSRWKEDKERQRQWLSAEEACARLDDAGLRDLVRRYARQLRHDALSQ